MPAPLRPIAFFLLLIAINQIGMTQDARIAVRFLAFPAHAQPEPVELIISKKETIEINTPGHRMSKTYSVPPLSQIIVGKSGIDEAGNPKFDVYGKARALPAKEQIVLLLRKGKENSAGFVVLPVNAQKNDFPGGSFMFINASGSQCAGIIGDKKFALKPGQQKLLTPKPNFNGDVCQVSLSYLREEEKGIRWKLFLDGRWSTDKDMRTVAFFYQHPKTGKVSIAPVIEIIGADIAPPPEE